MLDSLPLAITLILRANPLSLNTNPAGFSAVVFDQLTEPGVLQCLSRSDALLGVVDEDFPEQVQEKFVELCGRRDDFVQASHGLDKLLGLPWGIIEGIGEVLVLEEAGGAVAIVALALPHDFTNE